MMKMRHKLCIKQKKLKKEHQRQKKLKIKAKKFCLPSGKKLKKKKILQIKVKKKAMMKLFKGKDMIILPIFLKII